uniref:Ubiquitin thioesterase otulin n=1 Tax=Magallana gigas TaxID=29159 RepID=K1R9M9_MAGGI
MMRKCLKNVIKSIIAKAATVLCAIGIGFGIGSYLLYKLYCRLFPSDPKDREPVYTADKSCQRDQSNDADVEENEMGNSGSNETVPVRYDAVNGVQFGSCRTRNQATSPILVRQRRPTKHQRSHRRSSDDDETRLLNPHEDSSSHVQEDLVDRLIHSASDISAAEPNSGSLKGNLSLKSLYERNYKYGFDEHFQSSKTHLYDSSGDSLQIDVSSSQDLLTVSSVLLTPPSDDDRTNQNQEKLAESAEVGQSTGEYFEKIEHEVDDIVDEFADLTAKLDELKQLAAKHSSEDDMEYTPSDPLAKKACEFVEKAREKFHRSQSDTSLSESAVDTDGIDLSWDSEGQSQLKSLMKRVNSLPSKMVTESQGSYNNVDASDSEDKERKISTSDGAIIFLSDNFEACDKLLIGDSDVYSDQMDQGQTTLDELDTDSAFDMDPVELVSSREFSPGKDWAKLRKGGGGSLNIGPKQDILEYCKAEWRGQTKRASIMQKAYQEIPSLIECRHLHQVRGDNYCAIRGTLLQCFIQNINVLTKWNSAESVINRLQTLYRNPNSGLSQWTFAHRLPFNKKDKLPTMSECVQCLFAKFSECQSLSTNEERNSWPVNLLNLDTKVDLQCMEAIKLLMFLEAHSLYEASQKGDDVPVFVWLLFARDTSENPESLLKNHINPVGDSGGLEQIEMILLGHTLEVTIKVLRLQQYGEEDFVTYYPDDRRESWPLIVLIAEDDRHYNAPVV